MENLNGQKTFEELLKTLVDTHKNLMAYRYPAYICAKYAECAKAFAMKDYIPITVKVRNKPMTFLRLDNKYFCDFQRISELMEYADNSFRKKMAGTAQEESSIKLFRASLIEKARTETRDFYTKIGAIPNQTAGTGKTTNPNGTGK